MRVSAIGKSDRPAHRDFLDREIYVAAIAALITNRETETPLTIGIYGPWGSGKSSFLTQLADLLAKHKNVAMFNPWRLSGGGEVWAGLVSEIAPVIDRQLGLGQRLRFVLSRDATRSMSKLQTRLRAASKKVSNWLTAAFASGGLLAARFPQTFHISDALDASVGHDSWLGQLLERLPAWVLNYDVHDIKWGMVIGFLSVSVLALGVLYKAGKILRQPFTTQFQANLAEFASTPQALKNATFKDFEALRNVISGVAVRRAKRDQPCLVLLIDDLDRCTPDRVIGVLEAVNSFVAELPIVTVIALDTNYVCTAVAASHKFLFSEGTDAKARESYGRLFLEKIIHVPFQLPPVRSYDSYVEDLLTNFSDSLASTLGRSGEGSIALLPMFLEMFKGKTWQEKLFLSITALASTPFLVASLRNADLDHRFVISIAARFAFGLELNPLQRRWIATRDAVTQHDLARLERKRDMQLYINPIAVVRALEASRRKTLSAALAHEEYDKDILQRHIASLYGNPRSIKRFVNTYLLARGVLALAPPQRFAQVNLADLAVWLVLLQNWPEHGAHFCTSAQQAADEHRPLFPEGKSWDVQFPDTAFPQRMLWFMGNNQEPLQALATSEHGLDIPRCFSFFAFE